MIGMKRYPNDYFDLAIVDPVYGDVTKGGYMTGHGGGVANRANYDNSLWEQKKTPPEYFDELFRVSKNQIIWGGNYFVESIHRDSQCWLVWDKKRAEGVSFADCELAWTSFNKAVRIFRFKWDGFLQQDMKNKEKRIHPTQKPVALYEWILANYANQGDKILDTHVGSGSSRIACYNMGYDFTGYEINKTYYDLQEKRFKSETAQMNLFIDFLDKENPSN
jgi:site-specific DNA-methyltransferase (adenine-specific)